MKKALFVGLSFLVFAGSVGAADPVKPTEGQRLALWRNKAKTVSERMCKNKDQVVQNDKWHITSMKRVTEKIEKKLDQRKALGRDVVKGEESLKAAKTALFQTERKVEQFGFAACGFTVSDSADEKKIKETILLEMNTMEESLRTLHSSMNSARKAIAEAITSMNAAGEEGR